MHANVVVDGIVSGIPEYAEWTKSLRFGVLFPTALLGDRHRVSGYELGDEQLVQSGHVLLGPASRVILLNESAVYAMPFFIVLESHHQVFWGALLPICSLEHYAAMRLP